MWGPHTEQLPSVVREFNAFGKGGHALGLLRAAEPSDTHSYQPLWTLVGGGQAPLRTTRRPEGSVIPDGVRWIRRRALAVYPEARTVTLSGGAELTYEYLVMAPGLQLDWDGVPGLAEAVGHDRVSSNYAPEYAPRTWELIRQMRGRTDVSDLLGGHGAWLALPASAEQVEDIGRHPAARRP